MLDRLLLLVVLSGFCIACQSCANPDNRKFETAAVSTTPIPQFKVPGDWKRFEIGPFELYGPADLKKKDVKGIDSEVHEYENADFALGMDLGIYGSDYVLDDPSNEHETGSMILDGKSIPFIKGDLNKPARYAAANADGSRSKPVKKNLFTTIFIREVEGVVGVNYSSESSSQLAMAILQSIRLKRKNK